MYKNGTNTKKATVKLISAQRLDCAVYKAASATRPPATAPPIFQEASVGIAPELEVDMINVLVDVGSAEVLAALSMVLELVMVAVTTTSWKTT